MTVLLLSAGQALAGEPPTPSPSTQGPGQVLERLGGDTMRAGRELGERFAEAGRRIGHGAKHALKQDGDKIRGDVKTGNFTPRKSGASAETRGQGSR